MQPQLPKGANKRLQNEIDHVVMKCELRLTLRYSRAQKRVQARERHSEKKAEMCYQSLSYSLSPVLSGKTTVLKERETMGLESLSISLCQPSVSWRSGQTFRSPRRTARSQWPEKAKGGAKTETHKPQIMISQLRRNTAKSH